MNTAKALRYTSMAAIVIILGALTFWYFFIQAKQEKVMGEDAARGAGLAPPSLGSIVGSTYENIISSLSTLVSGDGGPESGELPRLSQVGKTPTAGLGFVGNASSTRLRFVERSTGYIFDVDPTTGTLERLTNTLIPYVYEAIVAKKGVILRGADDTNTITTVVGTISASSSTSANANPLVQRALPDGIRAIATSPTGDEVVYINGGEGVFTGSRVTWDGAKPQHLFSSNLSGWQIRLALKDRTVIVQKPSDNVAGSAYVVGGGGTLLPLIRDVQGLTVLPSASSKALLYGESSGSLSLFVRADDTSTSERLPIRTIADKCTWDHGTKPVAYCAVPQGIPPADFLDSRNRGETHTADAWWKVDAGAASAELLFSPGSAELDVENPVVDDEGNYIAFINARDKTLWLLRIAEN